MGSFSKIHAKSSNKKKGTSFWTFLIIGFILSNVFTDLPGDIESFIPVLAVAAWFFFKIFKKNPQAIMQVKQKLQKRVILAQQQNQATSINTTSDVAQQSSTDYEQKQDQRYHYAKAETYYNKSQDNIDDLTERSNPFSLDGH